MTNHFPGLRKDLAARVNQIMVRRQSGLGVDGTDVDFLIALIESACKNSEEWIEAWTESAQEARGLRIGDLSQDRDVQAALERSKKPPNDS